MERTQNLALEMKHITQIYENGFIANEDININVRQGEIHGLVGENGAGKTTLMKVLFGQEKPVSGQIFVNGQEVHISGPLEALALGIGMVHQHFMLVDSLTVAENMVLGLEPKKGLDIDIRKAVEDTEKISNAFQLPIDANARIADLSVGQKQRVEILKILLRGAKILLLDEPTAVLTPQETEELFHRLLELKEQGYTIVFISHKLEEVKKLCDRITVLRKGKVIATEDVENLTEADISRLMMGKEVVLAIEKEQARPKDVILSVRNLAAKNTLGAEALHNVSFDVRRGEILGVASVEGHGQSELASALCRVIPLERGDVKVNGKSIKDLTNRQLRDLKVSMIHEDRMIFGAAAGMSVEENLVSDRLFALEYQSKGRLNKKAIRNLAKELIEEYRIACEGPKSLVGSLSGGNIQKVVAAREFSSHPELIILSQPTRGIDVGAAELIRRKLIQLRDTEQTAALLFSADLTELLTTCDALMVLYKGDIVAYFPSLENVDETILGSYMLGLNRQSEEEIQGVCYE